MIGQRDLDLIPNPHAFDPPRAKLPSLRDGLATIFAVGAAWAAVFLFAGA